VCYTESMSSTNELHSIPDDDLLRQLSDLLKDSRRVESDLVAHIGEVDARRLYAREAASSMFTYCTEVLNLSEHEAYLRIAAARASRKYPTILAMLGDGRLHLSGIGKLAPHLTEANCEEVLARAAHKSKREIEELVAELAPRPDVPASVRKLPTRAETAPVVELGPDRVTFLPTAELVEPAQPAPPPPAPPPVVQPIAPARYKVAFTASAEFRDKLERLQALMHVDLADAIEAAVTEKLERLEAKRFAETKTPRKSLEETDTSASSRYMPAAVRRVVRRRDGDQCTFVDGHGRRCTERRGLEFHHDDPFGRGGDRTPQNIRLLCRAHNAYLAERDYGKDVMDEYRRSGSRVSEAAPVYGFKPRPWTPRPLARTSLAP